jgi:hypothetical protein
MNAHIMGDPLQTGSRLGCDKDLVSSFGLFAAPRCFHHGLEEAACALGRRHLGKAMRDLAILGKDLEFWEGEVAKAVMPSHQLGLIVSSSELKFLVFFERRRGVEEEGAVASNAWMRLVVRRRRQVCCLDGFIILCDSLID